MTRDMLISLCMFALATSATPGPNNAMLFASGVNHGLRRTVPHLLGVTLGFPFMVLALGLGVGLAFKAVPGLYNVLRVLGLGYMLYLAWCIATSTPPPAPEHGPAWPVPGSGRPITFLQATAFQWVNPKALMMCITAASSYAPPDRPVLGAFVVTGAFLVVGMPCVAAWAVLGSAMRSLLQDRRRLKAFNVAMAVLLAASAIPMAWDLVPEGLLGSARAALLP